MRASIADSCARYRSYFRTSRTSCLPTAYTSRRATLQYRNISVSSNVLPRRLRRGTHIVPAAESICSLITEVASTHNTALDNLASPGYALEWFCQYFNGLTKAWLPRSWLVISGFFEYLLISSSTLPITRCAPYASRLSMLAKKLLDAAQATGSAGGCSCSCYWPKYATTRSSISFYIYLFSTLLNQAGIPPYYVLSFLGSKNAQNDNHLQCCFGNLSLIYSLNERAKAANTWPCSPAEVRDST